MDGSPLGPLWLRIDVIPPLLVPWRTTFLLSITSRRGGRTWVMVSDTLAALSRRWEISSSDPANVPLSKPGKSNGLSDRSVTSAAVTLPTLVTALCEKKAPLCGWARQSVVRVCLGSWRGEAKSWQHSYGSSPNRPTMSNGQNKTLLYDTLGSTVGCSVTTGHSTLLPSWNLCQHWSGHAGCATAAATRGWKSAGFTLNTVEPFYLLEEHLYCLQMCSDESRVCTSRICEALYVA